MPYWDLLRGWVHLPLLLNLCELVHLLAKVDLARHSTQVLLDAEEDLVEHQKRNLAVEPSVLKLKGPISVVPNSVSSPEEVGAYPDSLANGTNQTDIQACRRKHWT